MLRKCVWLCVVGLVLIVLDSCYKGHGLSPTIDVGETSGIRGRITFTGTWPDTTREVRVAVLRNYPQGITDPDSLLAFVFQNLVTFSDTIPQFVEHYDYQLALEPGIYAWVLVAWFPDIPLYLFGVKELGAYYRVPDEREFPTPVSVVAGMVTEGIDIDADFANLNREEPFFRVRGGRWDD